MVAPAHLKKSSGSQAQLGQFVRKAFVNLFRSIHHYSSFYHHYSFFAGWILPMNYYRFRPEIYASEVRRFCVSRALESSLHSNCMAVARLKNRFLNPDVKDGVIENSKEHISEY
jgi:hypothetical protein